MSSKYFDGHTFTGIRMYIRYEDLNGMFFTIFELTT